MQEKFQFKLNRAIYGPDEPDTTYTAVLDGGCYTITWEDMAAPTLYNDTMVEQLIGGRFWLVE